MSIDGASVHRAGYEEGHYLSAQPDPGARMKVVLTVEGQQTCADEHPCPAGCFTEWLRPAGD
jgi:hypothetical protein